MILFLLIFSSSNSAPVVAGISGEIVLFKTPDYESAALYSSNDFKIRRHRRAYADVEESVGNFFDEVDFYLGKASIFRNILLDVRQLYKVLKNDVLVVSIIIHYSIHMSC